MSTTDFLAGGKTRGFCVRYKSKLEKLCDKLQAIDKIPTVVFCINDEAGFAVFDAVTALKGTPMFRKKVKQVCNSAMCIYNAYERNRRSEFFSPKIGALNYYLYDLYHEDARKYVFTYRMSALNVMTRLQVPCRQELSYVVAAYGLLLMARDTVRLCVKAQKIKYSVDISDDISHLSLAGLFREWRKVVDMIIPPDIQEAISSDKDFSLATNVLLARLTDEDMLNRLAGKLILSRKDDLLKAAVTDKQRQEINDRYNELIKTNV